MRYSAMPMRVPLFHSLAELMATMMRYYCHGEVPEVMLGNDSNLLIVFYVQIMPDDFVMQLHRF